MAKSNGPVPFLVNSIGLHDLLNATIPARLPVLITGMPGGGKTSIVKQAAINADARIIISHPVVKDPTDYKGFPWMVDGEAKFIPYSDLKEILADHMATPDRTVVFFIDDLGQASKSVQAAMMQVVLEREINGHKVADNVVFVAATNRKQDKAAVSGIIEPLKSRFHTIVEYQPDVESWVDWAFENSIDPMLIAFIRFRPQYLVDFTPTADMTNSAVARTVNNLNDLVKLRLPATCRYAAYCGAVGEGCAVEFKAFEDMASKLPNVKDILDGKHVEAPAEPSVCYALIGALIGRVNHANVQNAYDFLSRLRFEFQAIWHKDIKAQRPELVETHAYTAWSAKNGKNLS